MIFNSIDFMIFFPVVLILYFIVPRKFRYIWLLISSYVFYMCWNPKFIFLILTSTVITFLCGLFIENENNKSNRIFVKKIIVVISLLSNIGILAYFKYFDFILDNVNNLLKSTGLQVVNVSFDIMLPVGISFYTFQALSYVIDVYRGDITAEKNIFKYALYVSFFPQIASGPISRASSLLTQIKNIHTVKLLNLDRIVRGAIFMLWGYFLKMVIADRIAIVVNTVFDSYIMYGAVELIVAALGYSIQIYCDFASYSYLALGAAKIMGFDIIENFDAPYLSTSIKEFWRRWHISLSSWLKDYVYIPLGGSRCSKLRRNVNLMITFLVSGIWHGANWTYIVWGGLHGLYQIIGDLLKPFREKTIAVFNIKTECFSYKLSRVLGTFILVTIAWIFFRAESVGVALDYIGRLFTQWNPWALFDESVYSLGLDRFEMNVLWVSLIFLAFVDIIKYFKKKNIDEWLMEQNFLFSTFVTIILVIMIYVYGQYGAAFDAQQFIYFQF